MADLAGAVVGVRCPLEWEPGRGAMATVWLARGLDHEHPVAVKAAPAFDPPLDDRRFQGLLTQPSPPAGRGC